MQINAETRISTSFHTNYELLSDDEKTNWLTNFILTAEKKCFYTFPSFHSTNTLNTPKIIHRLSIDNPSIVHRFDGVTMEKRWSNDGVTMEKPKRKSDDNYELLGSELTTERKQNSHTAKEFT